MIAVHTFTMQKHVTSISTLMCRHQMTCDYVRNHAVEFNLTTGILEFSPNGERDKKEREKEKDN